MLACLLLLCWQPSADADFREWVYHAEVYLEIEEALDHLRPLHDQTQDSAQRREIARGLATVRSLQTLDEANLAAVMQPPRSVIVHGSMRRLYAGGEWFAVGDWFGAYFIEEIYLDRLLLQHRDGHNRVLPLAWRYFQDAELVVEGMLMESAPAAEMLGFIAQQSHMSYFIPGTLNVTFTGYVAKQPWLLMLESLGEQFQIRWTRQQDNIVFQEMRTYQQSFELLSLVDLRNEPLGLFLANLARRFQLNLILSDAELVDVSVDIRLENQPWNEVLDCLGIMTNFSWQLLEDGNRRTLFIQKNE